MASLVSKKLKVLGGADYAVHRRGVRMVCDVVEPSTNREAITV